MDIPRTMTTDCARGAKLQFPTKRVFMLEAANADTLSVDICANKTERALVSRQPIYHSDLNVFGYELLFRNEDRDQASFSDGSQATAQLIVNALMDIGMENLVGQHLAFINFERE